MTAAQPIDRTFYPVEEHLGESVLHMRIRMLLWQLLCRWLEGKRAFAGSDQFIYWRRGDPKSCVSPDAYVLPGVDPRAFPENWKIWETGIVPSFAIEIVSRSWKKDYRRAPERYAALGVSELVIFDPEYAARGDRWRWRVWRREQGRLELVEQTNLDRVRSKTLRCWLRSVGEGNDLRVRLGSGPRGKNLVPTLEEQEQAQEKKNAALRAEVRRLRARLGRR